MKIILQAGHENIKTNCDPSLRTSTGAGGEVAINVAVRDATAELLREEGIEVRCVDANFNCDPASLDVDWDLYLAIHCDMDYPGDEGSGFCDFPDPVNDGATEESQRLAKEIEAYFFPKVGINIKNRSNVNTRKYYMWNSLSAKTPCVLIEMGQIKDAHDAVILNDTNKVATALAEAILFALGIKNAAERKIEALEKELDEMRDSRDKWRRNYKDLEEIYIREGKTCKSVIASLTLDLDKATTRIAALEKAVLENKTPLSEYGKWEKFLSIFS